MAEKSLIFQPGRIGFYRREVPPYARGGGVFGDIGFVSGANLSWFARVRGAFMGLFGVITPNGENIRRLHWACILQGSRVEANPFGEATAAPVMAASPCRGLF
ncbi:hypothetical protein, partial [Acidiphilium sp. 20-67-58]|uniref:hypothetical protein n=1 Tax=Acidiphilium sp. 20-67-58 TaxID=1970291 RepID=UPI0025BE244C